MGYMDTPEMKKKLTNISITLDIRRRYIRQRDELREAYHTNINGFPDREKTQRLQVLSGKINRLTKTINVQRGELF